jgi:hypothetical protein
MQDVTQKYYKYLITLSLRNGRTESFTLNQQEFETFTALVDCGEYDGDGEGILGIRAYGLQVQTQITETEIWKI